LPTTPLGQFTSLTRYQSTGTSNLVASTTFTYDTLNRLTDLDHKQNSTNLALYDYGYDAMDRITSIVSSVDGTSSFTYDAESQLTAADHASPISDEGYSYDATGNRTGGSYTDADTCRAGKGHWNLATAESGCCHRASADAYYGWRSWAQFHCSQ
jgi:YD repeat-containing protein